MLLFKTYGVKGKRGGLKGGVGKVRLPLNPYRIYPLPFPPQTLLFYPVFHHTLLIATVKISKFKHKIKFLRNY